MKQASSIAVLALGAFLALPVFSQDAKPVDYSTKKDVPAEPTPVLSVPSGYTYRTDGRRDPFLNPLPKQENPTVPGGESIVRPPGLRGVLLAEVAIRGVVLSREADMTRVVIVGPGNKTYFAGRGDSLLDAVVKEIRPHGVVFVPVSPSTRQPTAKEVVRSVSTSAGENK